MKNELSDMIVFSSTDDFSGVSQINDDHELDQADSIAPSSPLHIAPFAARVYFGTTPTVSPLPPPPLNRGPHVPRSPTLLDLLPCLPGLGLVDLVPHESNSNSQSPPTSKSMATPSNTQPKLNRGISVDKLLWSVDRGCLVIDTPKPTTITNINPVPSNPGNLNVPSVIFNTLKSPARHNRGRSLSSLPVFNASGQILQPLESISETATTSSNITGTSINTAELRLLAQDITGNNTTRKPNVRSDLGKVTENVYATLGPGSVSEISALQSELSALRLDKATLNAELIIANDALVRQQVMTDGWRSRAETATADAAMLRADAQHGMTRQGLERERLQQTIKELRDDRAQLEQQLRSSDLRFHSAAKTAAETTASALPAKLLIRAARSMKTQLNVLRVEMASLRALQQDHSSLFSTQLNESGLFMVDSLRLQGEMLSASILRCRSEQADRRHWYNVVQELRGNIRVAVRIRPLLPSELARGEVINPQMTYDSSHIDVGGAYARQSYGFNFDRIFSPAASQVDVFEEVRPLIVSVVDGFCVSLIAWGTTGSGKTYTMLGDSSIDHTGLMYQSTAELFRLFETRKPDSVYRCTATCLEVYNDTLRDLLAEDLPLATASNSTTFGVNTTQPVPFRIRVGGSDGGGGRDVVVEGLCEEEVTKASDCDRVLQTAFSNRTVQSTGCNDKSSRSHLVMCIRVESVNVVTNVRLSGKLTLVDLAGSERVTQSGVVGARMQETQVYHMHPRQINKSLSALGDVICALQKKERFVPYRNSKLTYLLSDSLGANAKTAMIFNMAPSTSIAGESLCTLQFAARVAKVELAANCISNRSSAGTSPSRLEIPIISMDFDGGTAGSDDLHRNLTPRVPTPQRSRRKT